MKSDNTPGRPEPRVRDAIDRAHLKDPGDASHAMHRYAPPAELRDLVGGYWVPVWSVPAGRTAPQRVLQYPVCLLVVSVDYARFYGVVSGVSTTVLAGDGWAVGVMLRPAAGYLLAQRPVADLTDTHVDLAEVLGTARARTVVDGVRSAMAQDPSAAQAHGRAVAVLEAVLRDHLPVDEEGHLVNAVVDLVESRPDLTRVAEVCAETGLTERSLQRLVQRRLGLTPKWLLQRRRLRDAAERLREGTTGLGDVAAELGYADQSHFHRDFVRVTAMTPGEFVAHHRPRAGGPRTA